MADLPKSPGARIRSRGRGGRPRQPHDSARTVGLCVRFSRAEHARLVERANAARRSLLSFVRITALNRQMPKPPMPAVNVATIGELNRVGNNLNQAMHLLHMGYISMEFGESLAELETLLRSLKRQLAGLSDIDCE